MLVGKIKLDNEVLLKYYNNPEYIRKYSDSLIPEEFNISEIRDNQLYYVCLNLRKICTDYKVVNQTINTLMKGVRISGYVDSLIEVDSIYNFLDVKKLNLYLERL